MIVCLLLWILNCAQFFGLNIIKWVKDKSKHSNTIKGEKTNIKTCTQAKEFGFNFMGWAEGNYFILIKLNKNEQSDMHVPKTKRNWNMEVVFLCWHKFSLIVSLVVYLLKVKNDDYWKQHNDISNQTPIQVGLN